ncbi:MAG: DUF6326 family protein [Pseudomonadota bacterium]
MCDVTPEGKIDVRIKLSALWLFILLNIIFRDIRQFVLKSHLEMLPTGTYNGVVITEELMVLGAVIVQVPVGMVPASVLLSRSFCRPVTYLAALLGTAGMLSNAPTDHDDVFHLVVQLAAMIGIFRLAWTGRDPAASIAAV